MRPVRLLAVLILLLAPGVPALVQPALAQPALAQPVLAQEAIGYVKSAEGTTRVIRNEQTLPLNVGDPVYVTDLLMVEGSGSMGVTFLDNSQLSMGSGSQLRLTSFEFVPREEKLSFVTELLRGTLLYVSGVIAKLSPDSVSVVTPVATLSVRGTKFLARVED